jgi:hypothetical protein
LVATGRRQHRLSPQNLGRCQQHNSHHGAPRRLDATRSQHLKLHQPIQATHVYSLLTKLGRLF